MQLDAGMGQQPLAAPRVPCARTGCRRSRGSPGRARSAGRSRPGSRGSRRPGAGRTACRSPCRSRCSARRTGRWCRAGRSRGCAARATRGSSAAPARSVPAPGSAVSRRPRRPPRSPAARGTGPTTSRILSMSSGSGEILKSSVRQGCSPNARQMRCTLVGEIPTRRASSRLDQCVAPSGISSRVRTTTSSTWASLMVRGTPGRGSSPSPSSRLARNRARHLLTVVRLTPSRAATAVLLRPSAQASTIRARSASPCAVFRRLAQFSSVRRSASDSTSGSSLVSPMPPADRGPRTPSPPSRALRRNTTHVATRELKTGTLAACAR